MYQDQQQGQEMQQDETHSRPGTPMCTKPGTSTGKSLSEALIIASSNPQYDDRLFSVHENCKLRIPAEHVVYTNCCFCFDIQNNFGTQHVLQMLRASEKDLPVCNEEMTSQK